MYSSPLLVDATRARREDIAQMRRLLRNGWQHIGDDLWIPADDDEIFSRQGAIKAQGNIDNINQRETTK